MNFYAPLVFSILFMFCSDSKVPNKQPVKKTSNQIQKKDFNAYWYKGKAEITSYKLSQVRYGELHEGTAVNIFVTEDFLPKKQVKADYKNEKNVPMLKLNSTKKFTTGIYPYSLMTSTFTPIDLNKETIKVSFSAQEWCGNTFVQLNNRTNYEIQFFSYFESNNDKKISLKKNKLENEFWNILRVNPYQIKKGRYKIVPSFEFLALNHQKIAAYEAETNLIEKGNFINFSIYYPTLDRKISIKLTKDFPYTIESWEETFSSRGKKLITKATKIKTIQSAYWSKNGVANVSERKELGLD